MSGLAATGVLAAGLATPWQTLAYLGLGTLGSLLPDLDANHSVPTRVGSVLLAIVLAFAAVLLLAETFPSVVELAAIWLISFLSLRALVFTLLTRFTIHRGVFHSLPAVALVGMLTAILATHLLRQPPLRAWLAGSFVAVGYLVHLMLDELYSVNLFGTHIRRSLGTACKLWSTSPAATLGLYLACIALYQVVPNPTPFLNTLGSAQTYAHLQRRLLPRAGWFHPRTLPILIRD